MRPPICDHSAILEQRRAVTSRGDLHLREAAGEWQTEDLIEGIIGGGVVVVVVACWDSDRARLLEVRWKTVQPHAGDDQLVTARGPGHVALVGHGTGPMAAI